MSNLVFDLDTDVIVENEAPKCSHIIDRGNDERSAQAIILEAMVNGTPLTALCGHTWVPSRDPSKFPLCEKCAEMFGFAKDFYNV